MKLSIFENYCEQFTCCEGKYSLTRFLFQLILRNGSGILHVV
jgi:hypothetical protein